MFAYYLSRFFLVSVVVSFRFEELGIGLLSARIGMDALIYCDIIKNFFTGYFDSEKNVTVLKPRLIAIKYLKFYFWVDFISTLTPLMYPFRMVYGKGTTIDLCCEVVRFLRSLMIIRVKRWSYTMELFRQYMNLSSYLSKAAKSFLAYIIVMCWLYTVYMNVRNVMYDYVYHEQIKQVKLRRYFSITLILLLVSYGADPSRKLLDALVTIVFIAIGFCMQMYLYAQILQVWKKLSNAQNKNDALFRQFKEYMKYKGLPIHLRERVFLFFSFKFQNEFYRELHINKMISDNLRQEILLHVTKVHIQRVELFSSLPEDVLQKVVSRLKSEIFLPDEVIVEAGSTGSCMYFIQFGTVAVYTRAGREICHLQDGAHFGEIALVFNETRVATVVAVTACELYKLKRIDFFEVIENYPEQKQKVIEMAIQRLLIT
ncbi:unnamed protein product [Acanthoscelides obtectus]|nr:unnamed protein product [Acanthoscelides obtectus]CAK1632781.1 Potassium/sodium hyperpolarization-activated cyclic nucleotide-gated channel 1 [Acanthoscelides obtectus]